jgi:hypothetical protein
MHGSTPDGVVGLKVDAGSEAGAEHIAVEIFRLSEVMNANRAVAESFDVGHGSPPLLLVQNSSHHEGTKDTKVSVAVLFIFSLG